MRPRTQPPSRNTDFDFSGMDEYRFQSLCRDLMNLEWPCEEYGVRGEQQYGIDVLSRQPPLVALQAKRAGKFDPIGTPLTHETGAS